MLTEKSFTYTISSVSMYNRNDVFHEGDIDILPPYEDYDKYFVQCTSFSASVDTLDPLKPFYISLVADNLAENGYSQGLDSNQLILATITTSTNGGGILNSGEGSIFTVKNMKAKRIVRFGLYGPDMNALFVTIAPHNTVYWQCSLLFTPIA